MYSLLYILKLDTNFIKLFNIYKRKLCTYNINEMYNFN
jgi:hypothetical protein